MPPKGRILQEIQAHRFFILPTNSIPQTHPSVTRDQLFHAWLSLRHAPSFLLAAAF